MTMTDSMLNCHLTVVAGSSRIRFGEHQLYQILNSLTSDPQIINRAGVLILAQLASYRLIKLYDLKCIIYWTLKQLSYRHLARQYYQEQLA